MDHTYSSWRKEPGGPWRVRHGLSWPELLQEACRLGVPALPGDRHSFHCYGVFRGEDGFSFNLCKEEVAA